MARGLAVTTLAAIDMDRRELFTRLKQQEQEARQGAIDIARSLAFCNDEDWPRFIPLLRHALRALRRAEFELEAHQKG